jgi:hypothetical protein
MNELYGMVRADRAENREWEEDYMEENKKKENNKRSSTTAEERAKKQRAVTIVTFGMTMMRLRRSAHRYFQSRNNNHY